MPPNHHEDWILTDEEWERVLDNMRKGIGVINDEWRKKHPLRRIPAQDEIKPISNEEVKDDQ